MSIYIIGCTHFGHVNITGPSVSSWKSGFRNYNSTTEMNEHILTKINSVINNDDILYHLGDFAFGDKKLIPYYRSRINCNDVRLVQGNHDHAIRDSFEYQNCFTWCKEYYEFYHRKTLITMMHYPLGSWNGMGKGSLNIHSHCHGNYTRTIGRQIDVGIDNIDKPINLDELLDTMLKITPVTVDHHNKDTNIR